MNMVPHLKEHQLTSGLKEDSKSKAIRNLYEQDTWLPNDIAAKIAEFACSVLLDFLAQAVVSRQYNQAVRRAAMCLVPKGRPEARWLLTERMASNFLHWSQLPVKGYGSHVPVSGIEVPEDDALMYHCYKCRSPILRGRDIVSSNYHGAQGPAFLVNRLYNAAVEHVSYSAAFMTGGYTVSNVLCVGCRHMLGKKYMDARDPVNRFKVGKYLLEQTMVFLPGCCLGTKNWQHSGSICVRCATHYQSRTLQAVLLMTGNLLPGPSRRLREVLLHERDMLRDQLSTGSSGWERRKQRLSWWPAEEVGSGESPERITRSIEDRGSDVDLQKTVRWRLAALCVGIPGGVDPQVLLSFVDVVVATMVASPSRRASSNTSRSVEGTVIREREPGLSNRPEAGSAGAGAPGGTPWETSAGYQHVTEAAGASIPNAASSGTIGGSSAMHGVRSEGLSAAARQARWALVTPAAAAMCKDFQAARCLVSTLRESWQPVFPAERPGADRLLEVLTARLYLDKEDNGQLLQDMGLSKPSASCSWFPCRIAW